MKLSKVTITANDVKKDMVQCLCCGSVFSPTKEMRYTARDTKPARQALFTQLGEPKEYDAFDCPQCGCQIIAGERLRPVDEAVFALGDIDEVHDHERKEDDEDASGENESDAVCEDDE